jgi:hypothetical protein
MGVGVGGCFFLVEWSAEVYRAAAERM